MHTFVAMCFIILIFGENDNLNLLLTEFYLLDFVNI